MAKPLKTCEWKPSSVCPPAGGRESYTARTKEESPEFQLRYIQFCSHQVPRALQGVCCKYHCKQRTFQSASAPRPLLFCQPGVGMPFFACAWVNCVHSAPCLLNGMSGHPLTPSREMCSGNSENLELRGGCAANPIPMKPTNQHRLDMRQEDGGV